MAIESQEQHGRGRMEDTLRSAMEKAYIKYPVRVDKDLCLVENKYWKKGEDL